MYMKKILSILCLLVPLGFAWADTPTSCSNFGGAASGCNVCFTGSATLYEGEGMSASDVYRNTSTSQNQYLWVGAGYFNVAVQELNGASWEMSQSSINNMFEIPTYSGTSG
jgi:hypothetical protein